MRFQHPKSYITLQAVFSAVLLVVFLGFGQLLTGCAYRLGAGDRQIPGGYRTIAVPVFKNSTMETGIEVYFTNAIVREIERAAIGKVTEKSAAQVVLEGTVDSVDYIPVAPVEGTSRADSIIPDRTVLNTRYRVRVTSTIRLRRSSDQQVLWENQFQREEIYSTPRVAIQGLSSANALYNHSARLQNIQTIASDMMAEANDRMTENF